MVPRPLAIALLVFASCGGRTELPAPAEPRVVVPPDVGPDAARAMVAPDAAPAPAPDLGQPDVARAGSPLLALTPRQHDFGTTPVGSMTDAFVFTLSNNGDGVATGPTIVVTGDFVLPPADNKCAGLSSLPPGSSCTMAVMFRPQSRGMKTGLLLVTGSNQEVRATLMGLGSSDGGARLLIQPIQVQLIGLMGIASAPQRMTVANVGSQPTGQVSVALGGADASSFVLRNNGCLAPLAPGSSCTLDLVMLPTTAGMKSATLTASSPAGGMALALITGLQDPIDLQFASALHDFGSVAVGTVSTTRVLVLSNVHAGVTPPLTVMSSSTEFRIDTSTCPGAMLTGGGTCTVSVVFQPTSVGSKSAVVTARAGQVDSTQTVLRGTGF